MPERNRIKIVGGRSRTSDSAPIAQQPATSGLSAKRITLDRECDEVYSSLFTFRERLGAWFRGFRGLAGQDDIDWDDIEDQEIDVGRVSCGLPLRLLQLVLTRPGDGDSMGAEQFRSECGPGGPYFGCRRGATDDDYLLKAYGIDELGVLWDSDEFLREGRWETAFACWRREQSEDIDAHFTALRDEFEAWAAEARHGSSAVLRVPGSMARVLIADAGRLCPECLCEPPARMRVRPVGKRGMEIWISCPVCSSGRPDKDWTPSRTPMGSFYWHAVSSWRSVKELLDSDRIDSALADWADRIRMP